MIKVEKRIVDGKFCKYCMRPIYNYNIGVSNFGEVCCNCGFGKVLVGRIRIPRGLPFYDDGGLDVGDVVQFVTMDMEKFGFTDIKMHQRSSEGILSGDVVYNIYVKHESLDLNIALGEFVKRGDLFTYVGSNEGLKLEHGMANRGVQQCVVAELLAECMKYRGGSDEESNVLEWSWREVLDVVNRNNLSRDVVRWLADAASVQEDLRMLVSEGNVLCGKCREQNVSCDEVLKVLSQL